MNWINDSDRFSAEEEKIMAWAEGACDAEYLATGWKEEAFSYFQEFDNSNNAEAFEFGSIAELKKNLENMWGKDTVIKEMAVVCAVAAFRNKPKIVVQEETQVQKVKESDEFIIPDYVYVF